ncbi:Cleavage and polyadenylation specificity factor subunit 4 [Coemansia sp. BCRC 34301]|nr:Cleavage and polyadenylation specificity factor subunit 4 [Coemansia sp. BCRC 34301]
MEASTAPTVAAAPAASGTPANSKTTKRITSALDTRGCADIVTFDFEEFIKTKLNLNVDHVPVAQKPRTINDGKIGVCNYFLKGHCWKGNNCIYRHLTREQSERAQYENRAIVCKHWLRGLCKKSDQCEFLHEFNMRKMPECSFFSANGLCTGGNECPYQHINPESRVKECLWYARGFCKHGVKCRSKHVRKLICPSYRFGFCPLGPNCPNTHPRFDLPIMQAEGAANMGQQNAMVMPHQQ